MFKYLFFKWKLEYVYGYGKILGVTALSNIPPSFNQFYTQVLVEPMGLAASNVDDFIPTVFTVVNGQPLMFGVSIGDILQLVILLITVLATIERFTLDTRKALREEREEERLEEERIERRNHEATNTEVHEHEDSEKKKE